MKYAQAATKSIVAEYVYEVAERHVSHSCQTLKQQLYCDYQK